MGDPTETMRSLRRVEIGSGALLVVAGLTLADGAARWLIVGCGVLALIPISGAAAILRKAERDPGVLIRDPERRRARARRVAPLLAIGLVLISAAIGYAIDGWTAAAVMGGFAALAGALGAVLAARAT